MNILNALFGRTEFEAGGCRGIGQVRPPLLATPQRWTVPTRIDNSAYCTPIDDQGQTPRCAAFSMAAIIEAWNWRRTHVAVEIDPAPIYIEAKRIDGDSEDGTYLTSVVQAAKNLKLIPSTTETSAILTLSDYRFCIHRYGLALLSFNISSAWNRVNRNGTMPTIDDAIGGHAVVGTGQSMDTTRTCKIRNQWGTDWGYHGYCFLTDIQFVRQFKGGLAIQLG